MTHRLVISAVGALLLAFSLMYGPEKASAPFAQIPQDEPPVRVLFVGDLMLDRNVARSAEERGALSLFSSSTRALFADADVRVGNLEGTITNNHSIARRDNSILRFTFDPTLSATVLTSLNFQALSLANNHALDFADAGYMSTRSALQGLGINPFGHPLNTGGMLSASVESQGHDLCFVGYHSLFSPDTAPVVDEIAALRPGCWRLVVFAHWGDEYQGHSNTQQQEAARAFVDAGADLVVGAHPHVVQEVEVYRGKAIFYSLGNYMFDQNFSWEVTHSLAVRADFYADRTHFTLMPLTIQDQYSAVATGTDKVKILEVAGVADFTLP
ncbi:CapA family protein [Candidatus Kaiserbacteria bacterium]|nr:CapA family protein [Candidatus Kaiserbacteria bacterium]